MLRSTLLTNGRLLRYLITRRSTSPLSLSTRLYATKEESKDESSFSMTKMPLIVSKMVLPTDATKPAPIIGPKLSLTFTCTAPGCSERSTHQFSRGAYRKGVVIVQCPGCKNRYLSSLLFRNQNKRLKISIIRHLIADHLGWFKEFTEGGKLCTVEDLAKALGKKVQRGKLNIDGTVEYVEDDLKEEERIE